MNDIRKQAADWFQAHAEEMAAELQGLARIRSVSRADLAEPNAPFGPECRKMLDYALARANAMGFETRDHEGYCGEAYIGDGAHCLGFAAHLDVVPEGDKWVYPPYGATRKGDFLIGRGVSDNKAAAAMGLYLLRFLKEENIALRHGVKLLFGVSEETGMADFTYYAAHCDAPALTLIADAGFPVNYAQKGELRGFMDIPAGETLVSFSGGEVFNMVPPHATARLVGVSELDAPPAGVSVERDGDCLTVKAVGVAAHAASPEHGLSAIHLLSTYLASQTALDETSRASLLAISQMTGDYYGANAGIDFEDPDSGKTTMVIGTAETKGNTIRLQIDCRLSIAANGEANAKSYEAYAKSLGFTPIDTTITPPMFIAKDDPRVTALQEIYRAFTNDPSEPYSMGGGTYSRVLPRALTFGPGLKDTPALEGLPEHHGGAHAPDETLHLPSLVKAATIYACSLVALDGLVD